MAIKTFGKKPFGERLQKISQSPQYQNGVFNNIENTPVLAENSSYSRILKEFFRKPKTVNPSHELPYVKTDLQQLIAIKPTIVWFGHSSYLIKLKQYNILVDPVLSLHASPVPIFVKAFAGADKYKVKDIPDIDLLILTHDHYDHLDYPTIKQLRHRVKKVIAPLGVGQHLEYWGFENSIITEMDWWGSTRVENNIHLTATPARHFSGRGFSRGKTLWTSYVMDIDGYRIFLGGDSGYDKQFLAIGEKFGSFDLAILENGQYGDGWPFIHMKPEETVQAAIDLKTRMLLPVHWGKFVLANHPWNEPIERLVAAATQHQIAVTTPKIGEPYVVGGDPITNYWWRV